MTYRLYRDNKNIYTHRIGGSHPRGSHLGGRQPDKGTQQWLSVAKVAGKMNDQIYRVADLDHETKQFVVDLFQPREHIDRGMLMVNKIGLYSMTKRAEAEMVVRIIGTTVDLRESVLLDVTAGIGGFVVNMYDRFKHVYGYEINPTQFQILTHNCAVYGIQNHTLYNEDYTVAINRETHPNLICVVDPPWGGLDYKKHKKLNLVLGQYTMDMLARMIRCRVLLLKLPANHDLDIFSEHQHKVHRVGNHIYVQITKDQ